MILLYHRRNKDQPEQQPSPHNKQWWLLSMAILAGLIAFLAWQYPDALAADHSKGRLIYLLILLVMVSGSFVAHSFSNIRVMGKYAAIWLMIALVLSIGYTYRLESYAIINRLLGELTPDRGQQLHKNATIFRASTNGHFYIRARVNGVFIRFMVDTGASDVVLSPIDAQRIGIDTKKLNYSRVYRTANGTVTGAPTTLSSVAIGYRQIENVRASVNSVALQNSLLGMSFLKRLKGYAVKDQTLTLYW